VQFDGNESLPRGNGGSNAWLAALNRYAGSSGFLLAAKPGGHTYELRPGYKFLLGTNPDGVLGASGPTGTTATLQNSAVCIHEWQPTNAQPLELLARGPCEFVLGAAGGGTNGAVLFQPSSGLDIAVDAGIGGGATVVSNAAARRTLRTRGDGTVVLRHVEYTDVDGATDTRTQFVWQIGLQTGTRFFDGALRETGTNPWDSTASFPVTIGGGVLELGCTNLARAVTNTLTAGCITWTYGGGFAAHGGPRRVRLNGGGILDWNNVNGLPVSTYPIVFGSRTANDTLVLENDVRIAGGRGSMVAASGTLTLPSHAVVNVAGPGRGWPRTSVLFRAGQLAGSTAGGGASHGPGHGRHRRG
jgi:hypothetical protein